MDILKSSRFESAGFINLEVTGGNGNLVKIRTNVKDRAEFKKWLEIYSEVSSSSVNIMKNFSSGEGHRNEFGQLLVCHHNGRHQGKRKTHTR